MTHSELVERSRKWLLKPYSCNWGFKDRRGACSVVITEMASAVSETPDAIGWYLTAPVMIECKVSRSDFLADRKKFFRKRPELGAGRLRYFCAPDGLLKPEELPPKWGLLVPVRRTALQVVHHAEPQDENAEVSTALLLSALRRLRFQPDGHVSVKFYTFPTKNTATVSIEEGRS